MPSLLEWTCFKQLGLSQSPANWCLAIPFVHARWVLGLLPDCQCGTMEQTADHILTTYPQPAYGLMKLHDAGSASSLPASILVVQ